MHEVGGTELSAVLLAIVIAVLVSLGILHLFSATKFDICKLQMLAAGKTAPCPSTKALASRMAVDHGNTSCAVCSAQTTFRCSRCKAVYYCTRECQEKHWKQGHKVECCNLKESAQNGSSSSVVTESESSSGFLKRGYLHQEIKLEVATSQDQGYATCNGNTSRHINKILFPYDNFLKIFNWDKLRLPPCGLINRGNSCFANVVLQCLTFTRPLAAYLLQGGHSQQCRRNDWCFMCELQNHISRVRESQGPFSPLGILSHIPTIGNHLGFGRQEDAHEFMRFAIDSMQSICLDEAGGEKVLHPSSQETTLIHHIFGGHLQSQVKCMECEHESDRYENMMDLAVEIHGNVESLEDALTQFTTPEWLDGENKYKCDRCNAYVKARKHLTLHQAPNVLTIALKRFQSGKFGKLNKQVTFPEVLDISPYMSGKGDKPPQYQLYAVVVHVDMLNASFFGHYVCYVKDFHGVWYKVDDNKVKEVDLDKVMEQRAYMLLYTRCLPRPVPITMKGTVEMADNVNNGFSVNSPATPESKRGMDPLLSAKQIMLDSGLTEYMQSRSSPIMTNGSIEIAANADNGFSVNSLVGPQSKDGLDSLVSDNEQISLNSVPSQSSEQDDDSTPVNLQFSCLDLQLNSDLLCDDVAGCHSNGVHSVATCEERVEPGKVQKAGQQFISAKSNDAPSSEITGERANVQGGHVEGHRWPTENLAQVTKGSVVGENGWIEQRESCAISGFLSSSLQGSLFATIDDKERVPEGILDEVEGIGLIRENSFCVSKSEEHMQESTNGNNSCENPFGSSMWGYAREESDESIEMDNILNKTPTYNSSIEELKNGSEMADLAQTCTSGMTASMSNREETGKGNLETSSRPLFKPGFLNPKRGAARSKETSNGCEGSHEGDIGAHTQVTCIPVGNTNLANEMRLGNPPSDAEKPKPKPARVFPTNNTLKSNSLSNNERKLKIGRNDSCTCGSEQKFKKCCGKADLMGRQLVV